MDVADDDSSKGKQSAVNDAPDNNPEYIYFENKKIAFREFMDDYKSLKTECKKAVQRRREEKELKPYQVELLKMQQYLERENKRMIILFEGRDAAGKGGTIRRMTRYMNEKHYQTVALGKPSDVQKSQWFYQKYVAQFPHGGQVVLFDRSWYNRAMVEPIFGFCTPEQYEDFKAGVKGFEKDIVRQGTIMVKLYFSVTREEQARRFERRKTDALRQWKLSEVDVQAQDRWDEFTRMKYEMLRYSNTTDAPWTIIRSDDKHGARLNAIRVVLNAVQYPNRSTNLNFIPNPNIVVSGARETELLAAQLIQQGDFDNIV